LTKPRSKPEKREQDGLVPRRELDQEKTGQRAGTPCNLIRRPVELPTMQRVQR
jgi:hypothetical protein